MKEYLSPKIMYALEGTLPSSLSHVVCLNTPFKIGAFEITPIETSHDASNPCAYLIKDNDSSLFYMTDTGVFLEETLPLVKNPTYLIIESNHDIKMLLHTNRTFELKNRIMSDKGHLCNEDSAIAAISIIGDKTKEIVLAHLSEEANTPETALEAYDKIFNHFHINKDKYIIRCANQWTSLSGGDLPHEDLCNEDSAIAAISIAGENTKEIVLAHLSEEANTPEVALEAYQKIFKHFSVSFDKYDVKCANQWVSLTGGDYHEN